MKQYSYAKLAKYYDLNTLSMFSPYVKSNPIINSILKKHKVRTILDFTAGTGIQAVYLSNYYNVAASDLSKEMIEIAKLRAKKERARLEFHTGDMRYANFGKFDAVITIYNAIGHLSEEGFDKTLKNIRNNLKNNGIYIFDILDADHMNSHRFVKYKFIDIATEKEGTYIVRFYRFRMMKKDVLRINEETWLQKGQKQPKVIKQTWDMKIYTLKKLKDMLKRNNFKILGIYGGWGIKYRRAKSESIVIVAQKK